MLKGILFDLDNTLLDFDEQVRQTMRIGFEFFRLPPYEERMFAIFNRINASLWRDIENGTLLFEELKKKRWNLIFRELGIDFDGLKFEDFFRKSLFDGAIPVKGAVSLLQALVSRYPLFVASNGPYRQQLNRLRKAAMDGYFTDFFISEEIGAQKPSELFFSTCMARLQKKLGPELEPEELMIIGDSLSSDMELGFRFGLQTCYYNPHGRPLPENVCPDYTVSELREIEPLLCVPDSGR